MAKANGKRDHYTDYSDKPTQHALYAALTSAQDAFTRGLYVMPYPSKKKEWEVLAGILRHLVNANRIIADTLSGDGE